MDEREDSVLSIAAASPDVLVNAPVNSPTAILKSISQIQAMRIVTSAPEVITRTDKPISTLPVFLKDSKKPGPACIPTENIKRIKPSF